MALQNRTHQYQTYSMQPPDEFHRLVVETIPRPTTGEILEHGLKQATRNYLIDCDTLSKQQTQTLHFQSIDLYEDTALVVAKLPTDTHGKTHQRN